MVRRKYTPEFKRDAVRLVRGESTTYAQVGADLGVDPSTIRDGSKLSEAGKVEAGKALPPSCGWARSSPSAGTAWRG